MCDGRVLIIVPPFAGIDRPSLAAHIIQACLKQVGVPTRVLYSNIMLASRIGRDNYDLISYAESPDLIGERFFAEIAYEILCPASHDVKITYGNLTIDKESLAKLREHGRPWVDEVASSVVARNFSIVGCTTSFEQTAASIALLKSIKQESPKTVTVIGGANCEGVMAEGIASLAKEVDFVFSGQIEGVFEEFVRNVLSGHLPSVRIIRGNPPMDLDSIPTPDYSEFYDQYEDFLPRRGLKTNDLWLTYETCRGCWWGEKHPCTFCGNNGQAIKFRQKSPTRVLEELNLLLKSHPSRKICMVDNIMPYSYFSTLLPTLRKKLRRVHIFWEQKANLTLERVMMLKQAGIAVIQPGIESFSSRCLQLMNKGVRGYQNLALLRYARSVGLSVNWNLLWGIPGDRISDYQPWLQLIPMIFHLHPPTGLYHISIDRFSAYFENPETYGLRNLRPTPAYRCILPSWTEPAQIAYHFLADYDSESHENQEFMSQIAKQIEQWRLRWNSPTEAPPSLSLSRISSDRYLLVDTRELPGTKEIRFLDKDQASIAVSGRLWRRSPEISWAVENKLGFSLDDQYVPLATASPKVLSEFMTEALC